MIGILHDFHNIKNYIVDVDSSIDSTSMLSPDTDELVQKAFFPTLKMTFSRRENPMQIVNSLDKKLRELKMEMMLFEQLIPRTPLNRNKQGIVGGFMKRQLHMLDYPD